MKKLYILTLILFSTACSYERANQIDSEYDQIVSKEGAGAQSAPSNDQFEQRKLIAELAKKNHGLMHVHRFGPGFDVLMTLDAGDSDVSFSMKIPAEDKNERYFDENEPEQSNENKPQALSKLDDKKAELHHKEMEDRHTEAEDKKLEYFMASTKHIFSAQSLFYKKQFIKALDETNKALALVPESAQAHALKGSIYYKMGLNPEAKSSWQQALAIDPGMDQVNTSLARLNKEFNQ